MPNRVGEELEKAQQAANYLNGFLEFETICVKKSGRRHSVHVRRHLIRDDDGEPVGILGFAIDITELQQVRSELRERTRQLQTILDALPFYVAYTDNDLIIRFMNKAFDAITPATADRWVGRSTTEFYGARMREKEPYIREALSGFRTVRTEEYRLTSGEGRVLSMDRIPNVGTAGEVLGFFSVGTDVTDSVRLENARLQEESRLREALVAEVHHRVKNSLQGVVGLLRAQTQSQPQIADALEPAITQVLAVAVGFGLLSHRGTRGVVLCDMIQEVCRNIGQITSGTIDVRLDEQVRARPVELGQARSVNFALAVNELIFNAVKHGSRPNTGSAVTVRVGRDDQTAWIEITNVGSTLPPGFNFDGGVGLGTGLSLVRLLLPRQGCHLSYSLDQERVTARLDLELAAMA